MRNLLASVAAFALLTGAAAAADVPAYQAEPAYVAPVAYDWAGFYVGVHAGYQWSDIDQAYSQVPSPWLIDVYRGGESQDELALGAQIGGNFAVGHGVILGAEADFSWISSGSLRAPDPFAYSIADPDFGSPSHSAGFVRSQVDWLATLRGRVGYDAGRWFPYVTGGLAFGRVRTVGGYTDDGSFVFQSFSDNEVRAGWTIGAGVEFVLTDRLSVKGEYAFVDLGSGDRYGFDDSTHGDVTVKSDVTLHIVKAGLNYRF